MGRLRTRLSNSEMDRQVQTQVDVALRAIGKALNVCHTARRGQGIEAQRSSRVARDLSKVKSALGNIGRLTPVYGRDDPDLMDETSRSRQWWADRDAQKEAERLAKEEKAAAEAAAAEAAVEADIESEIASEEGD